MIYVNHDQVEAMTPANKIVAPMDGLNLQVGNRRRLYDLHDEEALNEAIRGQ